MLTVLAVANYRSIRGIVVPLSGLNLVVGQNGSGKSNLYRALRLLAETAQGNVIASLAREGGLQSTLWAGPEVLSRRMKSGEVRVEGGTRKEPVNLRLGFSTDELGYSIDLGMPTPSDSAFWADPEIKTECIWGGPVLRPSAILVERRGPMVRIRQDDGEWRTLSSHLASFDSMLTQVADPESAPEVLRLREEIRSWRFYDHFRTDSEAPARQSQLGTRTPVLSHNGHDLAAAIQTIKEIGDGPALDASVTDAFPGASLQVINNDGRFSLSLSQHGLLRSLSASELSDGTLRYLLWIAALLTPRPPAMMVLNEPETSLHPDLLPALARLMSHVGTRTQLWTVSHASRLIAALESDSTCNMIRLDKELGETQVQGQGMLDIPAWRWAERS